jgi:hypothetical protein
MPFFERIFPNSKKEEPIKHPTEKQKDLVLSEIKEEGEKIYFELSQEASVEKIEQIFNEITGNLDIASVIRQGFGIETDADRKILKVTIHTENLENIAGFKEYARRILESLQKRLKEGL